MGFVIEEGRVVYKEGEMADMQSAVQLKLDGQRLSRLTQILVDSGWHYKSNVKESEKATLYRNAIVLVTYRLLDWAIDAHLQ